RVVGGDHPTERGGDLPLLSTDAPFAHSVEPPAEALPKFIEELVVPFLQTEDVDLLEVLPRDLEPPVVNVDDVHVALELVVGCHGEDLRLVVVNEAREMKLVPVDLVEAQIPMLL